MLEENRLYLPYLLSALWEGGFRGSLTLTEGNVERSLLFHDGKAVNVHSKLQEETLGRVLLEEGKINQHEYAELLQRITQTKQTAGEILITMGILGPQDVFLALEFQTRKKLLNCFRMVDFGFSLEKKVVPIEQMITNLDPSEIILAGVHLAYSVDRLLTEFPVNEETVFVTVMPAKDGIIRIGPRESKICNLIGTGSPLVRLMNKETDLKSLLASLYALHALRLVEASGIERPDTRNLELPNLAPEPQTQKIPSYEEVADNLPEVKSTPQPELEDEPFRAPTLNDLLMGNHVDPKLAKKVLGLARSDHFKVLEITRDVKGQNLKNAFFRLLRVYHLQDIEPSYPSPKDRKMAYTLLDKATVAYRVLNHDESRKAYLQSLQNDQLQQDHPVPPRVLADVEALKGELALTSKRYKEAIDLFISAITQYPDEPSYHFKLGVACYKKALVEHPPHKQLPDSLRKPFLKAISLKPSYDEPRMYLGYISKRNGNFKRALKEFKGALESNPNNPMALSEVRLLKKRLKP